MAKTCSTPRQTFCSSINLAHPFPDHTFWGASQKISRETSGPDTHRISNTECLSLVRSSWLCFYKHFLNGFIQFLRKTLASCEHLTTSIHLGNIWEISQMYTSFSDRPAMSLLNWKRSTLAGTVGHCSELGQLWPHSTWTENYCSDSSNRCPNRTSGKKTPLTVEVIKSQLWISFKLHTWERNAKIKAIKTVKRGAS